MKKIIKADIIIAVIVAVGVFCIYLPALQNGFTNFDDNGYVTENDHIRPFGAVTVQWAFTQFYAGNWHPLTWISHGIDVALWDLNPTGHHLSNNILHALNTFLVILLMARLTRIAASKLPVLRDERAVLIAAATTGILFGIHPLHVESVAWISERKDLLCGLFFLLSLLAYAGYAEAAPGDESPSGKYRSRNFLLTLLFFFLAILSKPMAITLPVILLVLDWYPFDRVRNLATLRSALVEKIPFLLISLASAVVTILAQRSEGALASLVQIPFVFRLFVSIKVLILYLGKMVLPIHLVPFYPYPRMLSPDFLLPILFAIAISIAAFRYARKNRLWLTVWSIYVIMLLPVIGIVQVGGQSMADRYTYLPSIGPFFLVGLGASRIYQKCRGARDRLVLPLSALSLVVGALVILTLSMRTIKQIGIWNNNITLWSYAIEQDPDNGLAYNQRGLHYGHEGEFEKALEDFQKAAQFSPRDYNVRNNLGVTLHRLGKYVDAMKEYTVSIEINPNNADAIGNRGLIYLKVGDVQSAVIDFQRSCELGLASSCKKLHDLQNQKNNQGQ